MDAGDPMERAMREAIAEGVGERGNGIDLLIAQHEQIRYLLARVNAGAGTSTVQADFDELRRLLAVHETAEEVVLRPLTRAKVQHGDSIAAARMDEENKAKKVLAGLEKLGPASPRFVEEFPRFQVAVLAHARAEEVEELAPLRTDQALAHLEQLGDAIAEAERVAPTHPHPHVRSSAANMVLGPLAALLDRVRDAISHKTAS